MIVSTYNEMKQDLDKELTSMIKSYKLEPLPAYDEDCDSCNGVKNYYSNKDGDVVAYSCFGCNDVGTL
jgi:hypothetical protein